jgi:hypothetical protein
LGTCGCEAVGNFNAETVDICNNLLLSCKLLLNQFNGAKLLSLFQKKNLLDIDLNMEITIALNIA